MGARTVDEETIRRWISENSPSPSGGALLSETVEITDAQFKNLDSVGITLIDATGVGKAIMVTSWAISKKFAAGAYGGTGAGANGLQMYIEGTGDTISREIVIVASSGTDEFYGGINTGPAGEPYNWFNSVVENKAVELWSNLSNDMTGGNAANTLKVTVYYVVVDL